MGWSDLEVEGGPVSLSPSHRDGETRASGCHAPGEMMLDVLSSRNGYVILETGNETRRSRPPLTECHSTVQALEILHWPARACLCASCVSDLEIERRGSCAATCPG